MSDDGANHDFDPSPELLEIIRIVAELPAKVRGSDKPAVVQDVHLGGVFLKTEESYTQAQQLSFSFQLDSGEWIEVEGEVSWVRPGAGVGVKFSALDEASTSALKAFLRERVRELKRQERARAADEGGDPSEEQ